MISHFQRKLKKNCLRRKFIPDINLTDGCCRSTPMKLNFPMEVALPATGSGIRGPVRLYLFFMTEPFYWLNNSDIRLESFSWKCLPGNWIRVNLPKVPPAASLPKKADIAKEI